MIEVNVDRRWRCDFLLKSKVSKATLCWYGAKEFEMQSKSELTLHGLCGGLALGVAVAIGANLIGSVAAEGADTRLVTCNAMASFDKRLIMEQWAKAGGCSRPARTRVTDQFLGFTCFQFSPERVSCRAFVPRLDSRAFDTAKSFRCVEVALMDDDGGALLSRVREWASAARQCEWDPYAATLAMEVDFEHSQVCLAAFCIDIDRLSAIGATRLRRLLTTAFEELGLTAQAPGAKAAYPTRMWSP